jgi:LysM repeat protein
MPKMMKIRVLLIAQIFILAGCAAQPTANLPTPSAAVTPQLQFTPYASPTAAPTLTPGFSAGTPTPFPSPTATPRVHTVSRGQDMGGIAFLYGITIKALMDANPDVDPRFMSVGTQLLIPAASEPAADVVPSPTPVGVLLGRLNCLRGGDEGAWCFVEVQNPQNTDVESVSVLVRAMNLESGEQQAQTAFSPLNRIPAGGTLPLAAYFPPPLAEKLDFGLELLTALPVPVDSQRYLAVEASEPVVEITPDGKSAAVNLELRVNGEQTAQVVWAAAGAFNARGELVGVRKWESTQALAPGGLLPVGFVVYSSGGEIERVQVWVEARP